MPEYSNENRGVLFKNREKKEQSHADYQGNINVDGVEYWLNAWIKQDRNGNNFMSLSVKPKQAAPARAPAPAPRQQPQQNRQAPTKQAPSGFDDMDDDVPF